LANEFGGFSLQFLGAARTVTGSKYLVTAGDTRVMIDCGLFQGLKEFRLRNWNELPVTPADVDHVVLTHAHIDHTGYLPRFVAQGFAGPVWSTPATRELCDLMLRDSAHLQEEEAEYANRKGYSKHRPALPLYRVADAERALPLFRAIEYGRTQRLSDTVELTFHPAGHILGSAIVELVVRHGDARQRLVFSGDLGRYGSILMRDPEAMSGGADLLVMESTYGNREHDDKDPRPHFAALLRRMQESGGVLLVPAFAVGRTQEVLLLLREGFAAGDLPRMPVHLDSPMAIDATEIYCRYTADQRVAHPHARGKGCTEFFGRLELDRTVEDSKRLNALPGPRVIVSASGMATGGRILHHLKNRLPDPKNAVLFVGYQAAGTRGRSLVEGADHVKMLGEVVEVRATIDRIDSLSAHADRSELVQWTGTFDGHRPRRVYLTHGEPEAAESLAALLRREHGLDTHVPNHLEKVGLFDS
jgi:metallo-beta-lactamase family protein